MNYIKLVVTSSDTSTSSTYEAVNSGTISGSSLTASTTYLAILRARVTYNNSTELASIRLNSADDTDLALHSEFEWGYSSNAQRGVFTTAVFDTAATPSDVVLQFKTSGGTITVSRAEILLIDLDDLGSSNYVLSKGAPNTEPGTSWGTVATLAGSSLGTATEWLVLGSIALEDSGGVYLYGSQLLAADGVDTAVEQSYQFQEGEEPGGREVQTHFGIHNTATSNEDVTLRARQTSTAANAYIRSYNLIALKMSALPTGSIIERNDTGTTVSTETNIETLTAPEAAELVVFGGWNHTASARLYVATHIESDGTPLDSNDVGYYQNARNDSSTGETGRAVALDFMSDTDGTEDIDLQGIADTSTGAAHVFLGAIVLEEATTGQSVTVGTASETEAAVSVGAVLPDQFIAVGAAAETESAQTVGVIQTQFVAVGTATETEAAVAVAAELGQTISVGTATETETAQPVPPLYDQSIAVGTATETEAANIVSGTDARLNRMSVQVAEVTDSDARLNRISVQTAEAEPSDAQLNRMSAQVAEAPVPSNARLNRLSIQIATEYGGEQQIDVGTASETETAQTVGIIYDQTVSVGAASETETANTVAPTAGQFIAVGTATETEAAVSVTATLVDQFVAVGTATETEAAVAVAIVSDQSISVGVASETESAVAVAADQTSASRGHWGGVPVGI